MEYTFSLSVQAKTSGLYTFEEIQKIISEDDNFNKEFKRLKDIANKRIKRLDDNKTLSPAVEKLKSKGISQFTSNRNDSFKEKTKILANIQAFLSDETSTLKGAKQYNKQFAKRHNIKENDEKAMKTLYELEGNTADKIYTLSREEYYPLLRGEYSLESIVEAHGFDGDYNDYRWELEQQSKDIYFAYATSVKRFESEVNNLNFRS